VESSSKLGVSDGIRARWRARRSARRVTDSAVNDLAFFGMIQNPGGNPPGGITFRADSAKLVYAGARALGDQILRTMILRGLMVSRRASRAAEPPVVLRERRAAMARLRRAWVAITCAPGR